MKFHEKLSLLMDIAKTTNQELALYSCLDSSHISRLKNGNRKPVKGASYLMAFARFLAKRISTPDQQDLLIKLLDLDSILPFDQEILTDTLYHWLTKDCFSASDFAQKSFKDNTSLTKEAIVHSSCSLPVQLATWPIPLRKQQPSSLPKKRQSPPFKRSLTAT